jgi:outer membrane protein OmpA-like peptidoglycan-associated protein
MTSLRTLTSVARAVAVIGALAVTQMQVQAADAALDTGGQVLDVATIKDGLFPEDSCKELEASGFKCMGFKPATRYALPASAFKIGSADLPDQLRKQLDTFAEVLKGKRDSGRVIRIEGHTDVTGSEDVNLSLSQRRADAVKAYLVSQGASSDMLKAVGVGSLRLKVSNDPKAAENRRVEIGRQE